jgi:hypothetical protein
LRTFLTSSSNALTVYTLKQFTNSSLKSSLNLLFTGLQTAEQALKSFTN